jgi:type I restriction enzyme R subunit
MPLPDKARRADQRPASPYPMVAEAARGRAQDRSRADLQIVERAHPDLGRLGVVWHTQGSGKSYSMAFFAEKVRRTISGQLHLRVDDRPRRPR